MQNETASTPFLRYGNVFRDFNEECKMPPACRQLVIRHQNSHSQFHSYGCDVYVEVVSGIGVLLVSTDPERESIEEFGMNHRFRINPHVFFCFAATTPELHIRIYTQTDHPVDSLTLASPHQHRSLQPQIRLQDILGYYYRIRSPGYHFTGEQHAFFELTYVDAGILYTEVDGILYKLGEKELIIYGPGQFHTQHAQEQSASYVTLIFRMENLAPDAPDNWYSLLTNRVFPYNKNIYNLIRTLVHESTSQAPYTGSLLHCLLSEIVIRLLQGVHTAPVAQPPSVIRQNYQEELFDRILAYVESKVYEPLTVADICQQFSLSRSTLQLLFKNNVNQSPKKYISDMKLEKSCQMLRENKYTISEISLKLGYSSIHYFSNAFNQKYHIPPSEYAKRIY